MIDKINFRIISEKILLIRESDESRFRQLFNDEGGLGKMWKLFGDNTEKVIKELNEELAA